MTAFNKAWSLLKQMDAYGKQAEHPSRMQQTFPEGMPPEVAMHPEVAMQIQQRQQALRGPYK